MIFPNEICHIFAERMPQNSLRRERLFGYLYCIIFLGQAMISVAESESNVGTKISSSLEIRQVEDSGYGETVDNIVAKILITNKSPVTYKNKDVKGSCSCLSISPTQFELEPNQSRTVQVIYSKHDKFGFLRERVLFEGEDDTLLEVSLSLWRANSSETDWLWVPGRNRSFKNEHDGILRGYL